MKAWSDICQPKKEGGIGFCHFKDINVAFLSKLGWKIARENDSLWCRLLRAKYLMGRSFFEDGKARGPPQGGKGSLAQKSIL